MRLFLLFFAGIIISCQQSSEEKKMNVENLSDTNEINDSLEVYDFEELKPLLHTDTDEVYIVNFWATWCAPCVKELPYFEAINKDYKNKKVNVVLVSLDFPKKYDSHVKPFIKKHKLESQVVALNDMDSNTWIPEISVDWSGAIPATLIFNKDKREFYEQTFTYEELETELLKFLN